MFQKVFQDDEKRKKIMFVFLYKGEEDGLVLILMSLDIEYLMNVFIDKLCFLVIENIFVKFKIFFKNDGIFFQKGIIGRRV